MWTNIFVHIVLIALFVVTVCISCTKNEKKKRDLAIISFFMSIILFLWGVNIGRKQGRNLCLQELSQNVNLEQVSVKGESAFTAAVRITYLDSKVNQVQIIEETTKPEQFQTIGKIKNK